MTTTHICWFLLAGVAVYSLLRIQHHVHRLVFRVEQTLNLVRGLAAVLSQTSTTQSKQADHSCPRRT